MGYDSIERFKRLPLVRVKTRLVGFRPHPQEMDHEYI